MRIFVGFCFNFEPPVPRRFLFIESMIKKQLHVAVHYLCVCILMF